MVWQTKNSLYRLSLCRSDDRQCRLTKVLEYNCRFGDPETQPIMLRMKSDLVSLSGGLEGRLEREAGRLGSTRIPRCCSGCRWLSGDYRKDDLIADLPETELEDAKIFHAGTRFMDGQVLTAGGRCSAQPHWEKMYWRHKTKAYELVQRVAWPGACYRTDIGYRAIARERTRS